MIKQPNKEQLIALKQIAGNRVHRDSVLQYLDDCIGTIYAESDFINNADELLIASGGARVLKELQKNLFSAFGVDKK